MNILFVKINKDAEYFFLLFDSKKKKDAESETVGAWRDKPPTPPSEL